jgi:hypothetical protein
MTERSDEQAQSGPGEFRDVVDVHLLDEELMLAARVVRAPSQGSAHVMAVVLADGEPIAEIAQDIGAVDSWELAPAGPLRLTVEEPLERWTLSLDTQGVEVSLDLNTLTTPADLAEPGTAAIGRAAGLHRYAQLCEARGHAVVGGRRRAVEAMAVRTHRWGPVGAAGRTRFVTAASEDGTLLTLAAVQPTDAAAHDEELLGGYTIRAADGPGMEAVPFETVRLSTVFDDQGLPLKAGAELFRPGDELPSRLGGLAVARMTGARDGERVSVTLFRFGLDGVPALGCYEIEAAS